MGTTEALGRVDEHPADVLPVGTVGVEDYPDGPYQGDAESDLQQRPAVRDLAIDSAEDRDRATPEHWLRHPEASHDVLPRRASWWGLGREHRVSVRPVEGVEE